MEYSLYYLAHLVKTKNDLNRRRRRFYALMNPGSERFNLHESDPRVQEMLKMPKDQQYKSRCWKSYEGDHYHFSQPKPTHPSYTKHQAHQGYLNAQLEMKAMTAHMRAVRKELNARFIWSDHGAIKGIRFDGKTYWECYVGGIGLRQDISALAEHYVVDRTIQS